MLALLDTVIFAAAAAAVVLVTLGTLVPAMPRIAALLRTGIDPRATPAVSPAVSIVSEPRLRERVRVSVGPAHSAWREAA